MISMISDRERYSNSTASAVLFFCEHCLRKKRFYIAFAFILCYDKAVNCSPKMRTNENVSYFISRITPKDCKMNEEKR